MSDQQLLRAYVESRSDTAFAELVQRHLDFVYSTALRMVRDAHLAEDVSQGVFAALAQNARQLAECPVLTGWLYRTTRNLAANSVRADVRRRVREQEAAVMNELLSTEPDVAWERISPHLDDALSQLNESDREAILLRYFKNHDLRAIGFALGISDDAAQKRVSRAVERLREVFAKRGIAAGASGLTVAISANAVQAAPIGLAVAISTTAALAGTTLATTAVAATTKAIAMTAIQKTIVTATVAVLAGAGIYEARQAAQFRDQVQTLQQQQAPLAELIQNLQNNLADATNQLADLLAENARMKSNPEWNELLNLRGQVAAASRAAADAAAKTQGLGNRSEQSQVDWDDKRNEARAHLDQFFKLTNLSREKADQYVDLEVEMKRRQEERMKALLGGTLAVDDAARQRDQDKHAQETQRRALLGPDGSAVLDSIADGMRDGVAKRLTGPSRPV